MLKPLPIEFLKKIAREYALTSQQEEAFVNRYSASDDVLDSMIAEKLNVSAGAFRTRMTGVYQKFNIAGEGSGKFYKLWAFLSDRHQNKQSIVQENQLDINALVQQVRSQLDHSIRQRCGKMQILDMEHSIELTGDRGIDTNVNILERMTGRRRLGGNELLHKLYCG